MKKRRYLKKGLEKTLILINTIIFILVACINEISTGVIILGVVFGVNAYIINKFGKILK